MQAKVSIRIRQQSEMHETTAGLIWGSRYLKRRFWGGLISMIDGQMMARNRKIHYVRRASLKWANRREKPKRDSHIPKKANLEWMGRHRIDGKRSQKVRNQHRSINRSVKPCPSPQFHFQPNMDCILYWDMSGSPQKHRKHINNTPEAIHWEGPRTLSGKKTCV